MDKFPVYTIESAPDASKPSLREVQARFGMIPNLAGAMALSPVLIKSFVPIFDQVHGGSYMLRPRQFGSHLADNE